MKKKLTDIAIEVMKEEDLEIIGYNEFGLLDEVYDRARKEGIIKEIGSKKGQYLRDHPINRQNVVLRALENDKRFEKFYIRCMSRTMANSERLVREFKLRK